MTNDGTLSYPDRWPLKGYSPPAEDIQRAYVNGEVADAALDNELEWALSKPVPPIDVFLSGADDCYLVGDSVPISDELLDLLNDPEMTVALDIETVDFKFHNGLRHEETTQATITCERSELEMVLDAITEAKR